MSTANVPSFVIATLVLSFAPSACTVTTSTGPSEDPDTSAARVSSGDASAEATTPATPTCAAGVPLRFEAPQPAGTELFVAWERLDGSYFVERRTGSSGPTTVATGDLAPPSDARVAPSTQWLSIGRVVAVPTGTLATGVVDGDSLREAVVGATFGDALVWSSGAPSGGEGWAARVKAGFSVWKCRGSGSKSEAFVESTCDAFRFSAGAAGNGDGFCDWH